MKPAARLAFLDLSYVPFYEESTQKFSASTFCSGELLSLTEPLVSNLDNKLQTLKTANVKNAVCDKCPNLGYNSFQFISVHVSWLTRNYTITHCYPNYSLCAEMIPIGSTTYQLNELEHSKTKKSPAPQANSAE